MNNNSGIDHIKSQLFSEGKLFSFEGRDNGLRFFIITLLTLPIFLWMFEFGLFVLMKAIIKNYSYSSDIAGFFILFLPGCISGYLFFAAARRRLRDLNIPISPYITYLIILNIVASVMACSLSVLHPWNAVSDEFHFITVFMMFGAIIIDVIVLLIMFFIKGVSNVNQE